MPPLDVWTNHIAKYLTHQDCRNFAAAFPDAPTMMCYWEQQHATRARKWRQLIADHGRLIDSFHHKKCIRFQNKLNKTFYTKTLYAGRKWLIGNDPFNKFTCRLDNHYMLHCDRRKSPYYENRYDSDIEFDSGLEMTHRDTKIIKDWIRRANDLMLEANVLLKDKQVEKERVKLMRTFELGITKIQCQIHPIRDTK